MSCAGAIPAPGTGSQTKAANQLFLTLSTLRGQTKELERTLGTRLFDRVPRLVQVSRIGSGFLPLASLILEDPDRSPDAIAKLKAPGTWRVRIAAPQLMACTIVPEMIAAFAQEQPDLQVLLADAAPGLTLSKVRSGKVDFGMGAHGTTWATSTCASCSRCPSSWPSGPDLRRESRTR